MRKIISNRKATANYLTAVILLIAVMMATIIGSIVFFAFANGTEAMQSTTETYYDTGANTTEFYFALQALPGASPDWNISVTDGSTTHYAVTANYTYVSSNNTINLNAGFFKYGNTTVTISFNTNTHDSVSSVITYAITVFAMIAIVPLIMVGGLMLRSLGFMGGGAGKV